jgi:hypothetical protein
MKIASYPSLILYEVTDSEVVIHTVRHTSRRPINCLKGRPFTDL